MGNSKKIEYTTSPEIREAKELLSRVRDLYTYGLFDVLKLGIPPSEQLSKSLSKVTSLAHQSADQVSSYLIGMDREDNLSRAENTLGPDPKPGFVLALIRQFGDPPEEGSSPTNFVLRARKLGHFIFTDLERANYFQDELDSLKTVFYEKNLGPYVTRYNLSY